jgi:tetratricopeptide (TPR) repeat protein
LIQFGGRLVRLADVTLRTNCLSKSSSYTILCMTINILFLSANPLGTTRISVNEEYKEIEKRLRQAEFSRLFKLQQSNAVSRSEIQENLLRYKPNIVHFSGHGSPEGRLLFQNEKTGHAETADPAALADLFGILNSDLHEEEKTRCVILNACYSDKEQAKAIAKYVDCVIGMSDAIGDDSAISFASSFYQGLGFGRSVKTAFKLGCNQLGLGNNLDENIIKIEAGERIDPATVYLVKKKEPVSRRNQAVQQLPPESTSVQVRTPKKPSSFPSEKRIFVGREEEISRIKGYLTDKTNRPVSVTGQGGIGKSQLAFKAMHECYAEFEEIIPIYFESKLTFDKFLLSIAWELETLEVSIQEFERYGNDKKRQVIFDTLMNHSSVLIYADNYESISGLVKKNDGSHLAEEAVKINSFLENVPANTTVLLTSQNRVNLAGERTIRLSGLLNTEGRDLFLKFAAARFDQEIPIEFKQLLESLSAKVGGHPLALEILARRYRGLGSSEIEDMMDYLGIGVVDPSQETERFRSLEKCFDYSISNLSDTHKALLAKLIIFSSPFPSSAVWTIMGSESQQILLDLFDFSLLRRIEFDKEVYGDLASYNFLNSFHPSIRAYLESREVINKDRIENELAGAFSEYYLELLNGIFGSLYDWHTRGLALKIFDTILEGVNDDFDKAATIARDRSTSAAIISVLGQIQFNRGYYRTSLDYFRRALKIYEELGDRVGIAADYTNIGSVLQNQGNLPAALDYHNKALEIDEELGDRVNITADYTNIGSVLQGQGNLPAALEYYNKALKIDEELGDRVNIAIDYTNIGEVLQNQGNLPAALEYYNKALKIDEAVQDKVRIAKDYRKIGDLYIKQNQSLKALDAFSLSKRILDELTQQTGYRHPISESIDKAILDIQSVLTNE